jgi:hypothetical protein
MRCVSPAFAVCNRIVPETFERRSRQVLLVRSLGVALQHPQRLVPTDCADLFFSAASLGEPTAHRLA